MIAETKENKLKVLNHLAYESFKKKHYPEAIIYFKRYLAIDDTNASIYNFLGYVYKKFSKFQNLDKQIGYYEKALEISPDYIQALRNLALTYPHVGRYEDSIKCFHKLFELGPVADDYVAYGCLMLRLKNFDEGLKNYEYRFQKVVTPVEYPKFNEPKWEGQKIPDKTLLVNFEQGYGDSLQFCRYLPLLKNYADKVIFKVQNELVDLIKINFPEIEVVGSSVAYKDLSFDYHISLMSIPYALKANFENIPLTEGYIKADKTKAKEYKKEFFDNDKLKIGISWNGSRMGNVARNINLEYFYPLAKMENVQVYSFQKGFGSEQMNSLPSGLKIINLGKNFNDFFDTAAAMANLDLFVTSDNSLLNLAGTMGVKTFLLLNKHSEWRWFLEDEVNPWYSNVKILKKENERDSWRLLMHRVLALLEK